MDKSHEDVFKRIQEEILGRFKTLGFGPLDKINKFQMTQAFPQLSHPSLKQETNYFLKVEHIKDKLCCFNWVEPLQVISFIKKMKESHFGTLVTYLK